MLSVLFLCCDMGETNALIPVMHELQRREIDFKIVTMGAAINKLNSDASLKNKVVKTEEGVDTIKERARPLKNLASSIEGLQPLLVISGPASKAQEQLLEALPARKKIVYLDNFNYDTSNLSFETVKGVVNVAQKVICVSDIVKNQLLAIDKCVLKEKDIKLLGRPSLEGWVHQVQKINKGSVLEKIGFDQRPIVTFIGGYGPRYEAGVNQAYESAMKELEEAGYQVHVQHHPNVKQQQPLTTIEAVGMADWIVCYDSTVGFEALFAGKKVIYLQPKSVEPYDNIAIQKKLADCVQTNQELLNALQSPSIEAEDVYEALGVNKSSTEAITFYILKHLKK